MRLAAGVAQQAKAHLVEAPVAAAGSPNSPISTNSSPSKARAQTARTAAWSPVRPPAGRAVEVADLGRHAEDALELPRRSAVDSEPAEVAVDDLHESVRCPRRCPPEPCVGERRGDTGFERLVQFLQSLSARLRAVMSWKITATWRRLAGSMRKAASSRIAAGRDQLALEANRLARPQHVGRRARPSRRLRRAPSRAPLPDDVGECRRCSA